MLTITTTNVAKAYGQDATSAVADAYSISGLQAGIAGAFLGDSAASAYSGMPSVTSPGSAGTAGISGSPYAIVATTGSLTMLDGLWAGWICQCRQPGYHDLGCQCHHHRCKKSADHRPLLASQSAAASALSIVAANINANALVLVINPPSGNFGCHRHRRIAVIARAVEPDRGVDRRQRPEH